MFDASVIIPVNARGDLENVWKLVEDIKNYNGKREFETLLLINNFDQPPLETIKTFEDAGVRVVALPNIRIPGKAVPISARIAGLRYAKSPIAILFDADCRLPFPTSLIDWYIAQFDKPNVALAYTHVDYYGCDNASVIKARVFAHHTSRWFKRNILRIPTTRGSSYAVRVEPFLKLWDEGYMADDLHAGPVMRKFVGKTVYSSHPKHRVLTSGRVFNGEKSWRHLTWYLGMRLRYNFKTLRIRKDIAKVAPVKSTGRQYEGNQVTRNN